MLSVTYEPFMLRVITLGVFMLSVIRLNVIMLSVIVLSVVAPIVPLQLSQGRQSDLFGAILAFRAMLRLFAKCQSTE